MIQSPHDQSFTNVDGIARCSRYAFGPNRLHYCGPDASQEIYAYMHNNSSDKRLEQLMTQFAVLYPYLQLIASSNGISDPFDRRVVEAYWLGNSLLDTISSQQFYRHLDETLDIKKRFGTSGARETYDKLPQGALPHHSFHVMHIWRRSGNVAENHSIDSIDKCCISGGQVITIDGPKLTIKRKPIILKEDSLVYGDPIEEPVVRRLDDDNYFDDVQIGDWITIHWDFPCEIVTEQEVQQLERYTEKTLALVTPQLLEKIT